MNQRRWCVCDGSFNIKFELENWTWAKDRYGNTLRKPIDRHNHALDGIRYWLTSFVDSGNVSRIPDAKEFSDRFGVQEYGCVVDDWGIE